MMRSPVGPLLWGVLLFVSPVASGEPVLFYLSGGQHIVGEVLNESDGEAFVPVRTASGAVMQIPRESVDRRLTGQFAVSYWIAERKEREGDYFDSIEYFRRAARECPEADLVTELRARARKTLKDELIPALNRYEDCGTVERIQTFVDGSDPDMAAAVRDALQRWYRARFGEWDRLADAAANRGDYQAAIGYYSRIIECATAYPEALSDARKGLARSQGDYAGKLDSDGADIDIILELLDAAVANDPRYADARMLAANLLITKAETLLDIRRQSLLEGRADEAPALLADASAAYGKVLDHLRVLESMGGMSPAESNYLAARRKSLENLLSIQNRAPRPFPQSISDIPPSSFFGRVKHNASRAWDAIRSGVFSGALWGAVSAWLAVHWLQLFFGVPIPVIAALYLDRDLRGRRVFEGRALLGLRLGNAVFTFLLIAFGLSLRVPVDLVPFIVVCAIPSAAWFVYVRRFYHSPGECPSCGHQVSDYEDYVELEFSRCPHCGVELESPLTLLGYIETVAEDIWAGIVGRAGAAGWDREGPVSQRDRMKLLIRLLITHALRRRATDIHIELDHQVRGSREMGFRCRVRLRVDGILFYEADFSDQLHAHLVAAVKNMAGMDIADRLHPQDGHFAMTLDGVDLQIRASTSPTSTGEKLVLRLLDKRQVLRLPDTLGFHPVAYMELENAIHSPTGIVLAVGPTGSGKTTLLYSALHTLLDGEKSVVSVEDPIEYDLSGINQVEHDPKVGVTFSNALRNILRQDPDIIMVGEIRDRETLQMTVEAAKTGHLVFSTLHTIDSWTAVMRLVDMGASARDLSETLRAVVALRLVRVICPNCKQEVEPTPAEAEALRKSPESESLPVVWKGTGCKACRNTGYFGRTGLFEVLVMTDRIRELIGKGAPIPEVRAIALADGMSSLWDDGMRKVAEGVTTVEEVLRSCRPPTETGPRNA